MVIITGRHPLCDPQDAHVVALGEEDVNTELIGELLFLYPEVG
jgi:hypothetical protein